MQYLQDFAASFQELFQDCPIPMILIDSEARVLMINQAYAEYLGVDALRARGRTITDIIPNSRAPEVLRTGIAETASVMQFTNGREAVVHRVPLHRDGKVVGLWGMLLFKSVRELEELVIKNHLLQSELDYYKRQFKQIHGAKYDLDSIIGESPALCRWKDAARRVACLSANVLITGESGVGKELFAHAIHNESPRQGYPFVRVNCAAIPEQLLESELFGYEEGAFTGARKGGRLGKFEQAHRGTLFLDEIGDMPLTMQAKILRVLQEREVDRVGGREPVPIDVRVIAATSRNLDDMISHGAFRLDLYYRLNVLGLHVPPLRERPQDIPYLVAHFMVDVIRQMGSQPRFGPRLMDLLQRYRWPGNVRELRNLVVRIAATADAEVIEPPDLPPDLLSQLQAGTAAGTLPAGGSLADHVQQSEREQIERALQVSGYNRSRAAEILQIPRSKLYRKLEKYGIPLPKVTESDQ